jgi:hypothetical protein
LTIFSGSLTVPLNPTKEQAMGLWIELGIFGLVLLFAWWQLHDVKKARAQRLAQEEKARQETELQ